MDAGSPDVDVSQPSALERGRFWAGLMAAWLVIGLLFGWIGSRWSPLLLLPALAGGVTGLATGYLLHGPFARLSPRTGRGRTSEPWGCIAVVVGTLIVVALQHVYPYYMYRQAITQAVVTAQNDPQTAAKLELSGLDVRPQRFDAYLQAQASRGRPWLAGVWLDGGVWFTWGIDALVTLIGGIAAGWWYRRNAVVPASA